MIHLHSLLFLSLLTASAFLAGIMDTIAGGGGLITMPLLLLTGMPAPMVLGTNKIQATLGSGTAAWTLVRHSKLKLRSLLIPIIISLLAAVLGTLLVLQLHPEHLKRLIPIPLGAVLLYMICNPKIGVQAAAKQHNPTTVYSSVAGIFGFYDGLLGPGTGTFLAVSLVHFLGLDLRAATIRAKLFNFLSNVAALVVFLVNAMVALKIGFLMAIGQFLGAKIGSHIVIRHDIKVLRWLFITVSTLLLVALVYEQLVA